MRYLGIAVMAMVLVMATAGTAPAGQYHTGDKLSCSQCHVMHYSLSHGYSPQRPPSELTGGPYHYLLKFGYNELCLSCHDGSTHAPDVLTTNAGGNVRQAGALNNDGVGSGDYNEFTGHSLGSTKDAPGGTSYVPGTEGLSCMDCHHQHGYAGRGTVDVAGEAVTSTYVNLNAFAGFGVSYAVGMNDKTKDVFVRVSREYDVSNVDFNEPSTKDSGMARFCKGCHELFHGDVGGNEIGGEPSSSSFTKFDRHPNSTVNIGDIGGGHSNLGDYSEHKYRVKVMTTGGDWGTQGAEWTAAPTGDLTPTCITCHKSHGNKNPFGLIYLKGDSAITEEGDGGSVKDLCQQCHVQG